MKAKKYFTLILLTLTLTVNAQITSTWTGSASSDWSNSSNWQDNTIPAAGNSIVIPATAIQPVLDSDRTVGDLSIESGGELSLGAFQLTVLGNWNNAGLLHAGTSTVSFNGTANQEITGDQSFFNLTIDNEAGVSIISGADSLRGVLSLVNGHFFTNDLFVIASDANATGSIGTALNGYISGNVTVQRYLQVLSSEWRFFSSPVSNATLNEISDDFWTSGFPGSTFPSETFVSVYYYDESYPGTADFGYVPASSMNDTLETGLGFMAYIGTTSLETTIEFTGTPNTGTISLPVTYTLSDTISDGWNLVGNPYPSAINWDDSSITKSGIYNAIYLWNPELQTYTSYVDGLGTNGGSAIIPSSKSFYVLASAPSPVLQVTENCKTAEQTVFLKSGESASALSMVIENSAGSDQAIFKMNNNATTGFDGSYDATKMYSTTPGLPMICSTMPGDLNNYYSINQFDAQEISIPVSVWTTSSEMHTLSFDGISAYTDIACVMLEDLATGMVYNLAETPSVSFYLSDTTSSPRFLLKFGAPVETEGYNATCFDAHDGFIHFAKNSASTFDVTWSNDCGTVLLAETGVYQISSIDNLDAGMYTIQSTDQLCGNRVDTIWIEQPAEISAQFTSSADTLYLPGDETVVSFLNGSAGASYFLWETDGQGTSSNVHAEFEFDSPGVYNVSLSAFQSDACFDKTEKQIHVISVASAGEVFADEMQVFITGQDLVLTADAAERVEVRNLAGQLLFSEPAFTGQTSIDLSGISHQLLVVSLFNDGEMVTKKVVY